MGRRPLQVGTMLIPVTALLRFGAALHVRTSISPLSRGLEVYWDSSHSLSRATSSKAVAVTFISIAWVQGSH